MQILCLNLLERKIAGLWKSSCSLSAAALKGEFSGPTGRIAFRSISPITAELLRILICPTNLRR